MVKLFRIYNIDVSPATPVGIGYPTNSSHLSVSSDGLQITFFPRKIGNVGNPAPLPNNSTVALWIKAGAFEDLSGNENAPVGVSSYQFTTAPSGCLVQGAQKLVKVVSMTRTFI